MADTFKQWASKQIHKADEKITNAQKLTSGYILNKYETWGDVYKAAGIPVPSIPEKDQIKPTALKAKTVLSQLNLEKRSLQLLQDQINFQETGTPEYNKLIKDYNDSQIKITNLTNQYEDLNAVEKNIDKVDAAKKKTGTLKSQIATLEKSKQRAVDLGQDTKTVDAQINKLKDDLTQARTVVKTTDVTPNYKEPGITPESKGPKGDKKIIDAEVADKGITPKANLTPTPKTPNPKTPKVPTEKTAEQLETEALNVAAGSDFDLPETLFKNIPSLNAILKRYVDEKWTPDKLRKAIRDDVWYKQNSAEIKARYVQYYNYRDMQASGQAQGTTDYEMQINKIEAKLKKRAVEIGSAAASDPAALRKAAENLYITNRSEDESFIDDFLAASIRKIGGTIGGKGTEGYSGQALTNYKELLKTARDNGLKVSDIIPGGSNEQQVLQGIASGKLDINRIIEDTRKLASQGQPQYVRDLLSQGYNLNQVFAPYRQTMAAVLEIDDPNSIDLNDPLLRSAISDKGDMNIYEFKKALRKDNRWQYTEQARQDVSSATLDILRDFGFQG
jgi:hypothetical protein